MKRVLVDVNVVLDVLLDREPHVESSSAVWRAVEQGRIEGLLSDHAVTTIYYLVRTNVRNEATARRAMASLLRVFKVALVDDRVIQTALSMNSPDFEDAVSAAAALAAGCELIVTRDPAGFRGSAIEVVTPGKAVARLDELGG